MEPWRVDGRGQTLLGNIELNRGSKGAERWAVR